MEIYQAKLHKLSDDEIRHITHGIPVEERLCDPEGKCPDCRTDKWWILPVESNAVVEGGKAYCECMNCGYQTHL